MKRRQNLGTAALIASAGEHPFRQQIFDEISQRATSGSRRELAGSLLMRAASASNPQERELLLKQYGARNGRK